METKQKETIYILTKADRERIESAMELLCQVVRELISNRRTRISTEVHSPGALYQLAEELENLREK